MSVPPVNENGIRYPTQGSLPKYGTEGYEVTEVSNVTRGMRWTTCKLRN